MSLFLYPKQLLKRSYAPRVFKRYQTYKRYLQAEFQRVCVYCRQPDTSAPNLNFGVDHYKPKGIPKFNNLVCNYENLFYCCGNCNSRKNNYWPQDENAGPYVVNPCDHVMADHLRYDNGTGKIAELTPWGVHTAKLLQLNDEEAVGYRKGAVKTVSLLGVEIKRLQEDLQELGKLLRRGDIDQATHDDESRDIRSDLDETQRILNSHTGQTVLRKPPGKKMGVALLIPC